jgi:hypothetical protein
MIWFITTGNIPANKVNKDLPTHFTQTGWDDKLSEIKISNVKNTVKKSHAKIVVSKK